MLSCQLVCPRNVPVSTCMAVGWQDTLPHPAVPHFHMCSGENTVAPRLAEWAQLLTSEGEKWGVAAEMTRPPPTFHKRTSTLMAPTPSIISVLAGRQTFEERKYSSLFPSYFYLFLFAFWISIDCASVKKSLFFFFYNFYLNSLQHKMNDYSKFPTKSAKSKWVSSKCTNSVYQKAYHKYTHFESMHGAMQFHWGKPLV